MNTTEGACESVGPKPFFVASYYRSFNGFPCGLGDRDLKSRPPTSVALLSVPEASRTTADDVNPV